MCKEEGGIAVLVLPCCACGGPNQQAQHYQDLIEFGKDRTSRITTHAKFCCTVCGLLASLIKLSRTGHDQNLDG